MRLGQPGPPDWIEMEVIEAEPPRTTIEESVTPAAGAGPDRVLAPLTRAILRRGNERAMRRLAAELERGS
jgi:hypothetical protein